MIARYAVAHFQRRYTTEEKGPWFKGREANYIP